MTRRLLTVLAALSIASPHSRFANATDFDKRARLLDKQLRQEATRPTVHTPTVSRLSPSNYPWKTDIVTSVFWIGQPVSTNQQTSRDTSAWDPDWSRNYGGYDNPDPSRRREYIPINFIPRQNPFYCALPYNDILNGQTKPEAPSIVPWFQKAFVEQGHSVCKDRWLAIRRGSRVCYAQWEDCGPFRTDNYQYVFRDERPRMNPNHGAGLNVSPAVRDYLGLGPTSLADWQFVEVRDVPPGPWRNYGDNNNFVIARRQTEQRLAIEYSLRPSAEQNDAKAQSDLGVCYANGQGVTQDFGEAAKWFHKAAEQNYAMAQVLLGNCYGAGDGVVKDYVEAYKWYLLAAAQGEESAKKLIPVIERMMTREQIALGQELARNFNPREVPAEAKDNPITSIPQSRPKLSGTGFFITEDGYLITNEHVAGDGAQVRLITATGIIPAKVVKVDGANDLALLRAEGKFAALPLASSRPVKLGGTVATIGFPNIEMQGFAPKFARGEIGSLSGPEDDPRYFQISVPVQPGNSGGALVDEHGNVVGVVSGKLSAKAALSRSGALPENVNYAVKSSFLLGFLESVPEVAAKLKEPNAKNMKFEDVVEQAKEAAVLVLVY